MHRKIMMLSVPAFGLLCLLLSSIEADPVPKAAASPAAKALEVICKDGKIQWKLNHSGSVPLWDLVSMFAEAHDVKLVYFQSRQFHNTEYQFLVPGNGAILEGEEIGTFVFNLLDEHKVTITGFTRGQARVSSVNDIQPLAIFVSRQELETIHCCEYVSCCYVTGSSDPGNLASAMRVLVRTPMNVQPGNGSLVLTGRAAQVRQMIRFAESLDLPRSNEPYVARYEIPEGADVETVYAVLNSLFPPLPQQMRMGSVLAYTLLAGSLLVRGTSIEHQQVRNIIDICGIK